MWRPGKVNSFHEIPYCIHPEFKINRSLWVFWFYWSRRPVFHEELVGKEKGRLEYVNVIWFQWPSKTERWVRKIEENANALDK